VFAKPRIERSSRQIMQDMQDEAMGRGLNRRQQDIGPGQSKLVRRHARHAGRGAGDFRRARRVVRGGSPADHGQRRTGARCQVRPAGARTPTSGSMQLFSWTWDAGGRRLAEGMPLYAVCRGNPSPDAPTNLNCPIAA
jgi:hypothetical protein